MTEACPTREQIVVQIKHAMTEIFSIHSDEVTAAIRGDFSTHDNMRGRLEKAQERESLLIDRLRRHTEEHGC